MYTMATIVNNAVLYTYKFLLTTVLTTKKKVIMWGDRDVN